MDVEIGELIVSVQIPFGTAIVLNAIIWAAVMLLIGITFHDQPENNKPIQQILSFAAPSSMLLLCWLSRRYRRQSSTR